MEARTRRLYQRDPFLTRFKATILDVRAEPPSGSSSSARLGVILDRTAFYPTGGGQPNDAGTLAGLPVVDVREGDGGPLHILEMRDAEGQPHGAHLTVGAEVEGTVDWRRRFDHMQQHSGQHILSRAFVDVAKARTRSFHLGEASCTIDVDMPVPDEGSIQAAEDLANEIVWSDRPVAVREVPPEESPGGASPDPALSGLSLKPGDPIRFIEVEGFDSTACGGTHVARSGQVGLVAVIAWERFKGMSRVTFVCGSRAAAFLRGANETLASCVSKLSSRPAEMPAAIDRILLENQELERRVGALVKDLAGREAEAIAATAPLLGVWRVLRRTFRASERTVEEAQVLVRRFVEAPGRLAMVAVVESGAATILAARSAPAKGEPAPATPKMGDVVGEVCRRFGARGGGAETFARAGGIPEERVAEILDALAADLAAAGPPGRA